MSVADEAVLFYGGHFSHSPRCAISLEGLIEDYFQLPVEVQQFCGQFLQLSPDEQSSLPTPQWPEGLHLQLGEDVIVGEQVWDVQSKFRFRLGPLNYEQFQRFLPTGDKLRQLGELARLYVGMEFDFDVQLVLLGAEVPECILSCGEEDAFALGWNTWVRSEEFDHDADDAVFVLT
jgi:type VI secretion system protein ImpH